MQIPKSDVREAILAAARTEFIAKGYKQASMRRIAELAGVTPGNIYSYFPGKEALFMAVMGPVATDLQRICQLEFPDGGDGRLAAVVEAVFRLFLRYRGELILLVQDDGPYAERKSQLINLAAELLLPKLPPESRDPDLARALSAAIIEGLTLLLPLQRPDDELRQLVNAYLRHLLFPLTPPAAAPQPEEER